jgi:predicted nucleic acid-binding protein
MDAQSGSGTEAGMRRVYMDVCALGRPLDDQAQMRIRVEADAVHLILSYVTTGDLSLIVSPAHIVEIEANPDPTGRDLLLFTLQQVGQYPAFDRRRVRRRAEELVQRGLGAADAAHLAFAEAAEADFVSCDDRLIRQCRRIRATIWVGNPVEYCVKENLR